jgi:hypothetical protein
MRTEIGEIDKQPAFTVDKTGAVLVACEPSRSPKEKREADMAKIDLDSLSIEGVAEGR